MSDNTRLNELLDRWEELREHGAAPSLETLCGDSPKLLDDLRRRIADLGQMDLLLGGTEGATADRGGETGAPPLALPAVCPYVDLQFHARGGLGEVYKARDERLDRVVALKIIQSRSAGSRDGRQRFEREAAITGRLEHPGVAPVYASGRCEDGRPYYVMRFIDGETLGDAVRRFHSADLSNGDPGERSVGLRGLLSRFIQVCNTIEYAHGRGVLHRDIKPSNVMLRPYGETLVVDWGLAKIIEEGDREAADPPATSSPDETAAGSAVGTPAFMAPERLADEPVTIGPASDVYSLGATLYCILTGRAPFVGENPAAIQDRVRKGEFPGPREVRQDVPRALEAICLKAMALRLEDRFASVRSLAAEIQKWLDDEPVTAWREPMTLRASRWARRNRTAVLGAAAALLVGVIGLSATAAVQSRANKELRGANAATNQARNEAETSLSEAIAAKKATEQALSNSEASRRTVEAVLGFLKNDVLAAARPIGRDGGLGVEVTVRKAVDSAEARIAERFRDEPNAEVEVRNTLGGTYYYLGEVPLAIRQWERVLSLSEEKLGPGHPETLACRNDLAEAYLAVGRADEAIALHEATLKLCESTLGPDHYGSLSSRNNLAAAYKAVGRTDVAVDLFKANLEKRQALLGPGHADTLTSRNNLGSAYIDVGRTDEAITMLEATVKLCESNLGPDHPITLGCRQNLISAHGAAGRPFDATAQQEATLKLSELKLGPDHPDTLVIRNNLAEAYFAAGRTDDAVAMHQMTLALLEKKHGPNHPNSLTSRSNLAATYWFLGRLDQSVPLYESTLRRQELKLGPAHPDTLATMANLGVNYRDVGRLEEGIRLLERAMERCQARYGAILPALTFAITELAVAYDRGQRFDKSEPLHRKALAAARERAGPAHPSTAAALASLGANLIQQRKWAGAAPVLRECLTIREKARPDDWSTFNTRSQLGASLLGEKKFAEAAPLILAGYEGMLVRATKIPANGKLRLNEAALRVVQLYEAWGKVDEAAHWKKRLRLADLPADVFATR